MVNARPVEGVFRRWRWAANAALIAILVAIPWIRVAGEPLILLDIPARRFHVMGLVIFPQELYFLWLIVAALVLSLFFFTALAGRLWCGWACPQTVFTDVFAAISRRIEGWGNGVRRPSTIAPWRRGLEHVVLALLCVVIAFHFVAYFRSPYEMLGALRAGSFSGASAAFLLAAAVITYLDFVWIRQNFCKYLCPYARFQSVLFDRDTLVVGYDSARGEPRGKRAKAAGDCVDCGLCVQVCPTGIDIRDGLQLECIACTQCIDACNGVMGKLAREPDLIGYRSLASLEQGRPARLFRPRVALYGALLLVVGFVFVDRLSVRSTMDLQVIRNGSALFANAADGRPVNAFTLRIQNRSRAPESYAIRLETEGPFELVAGMNPVKVPAIESAETSVFVVRRAGAPIPAEGGPATSSEEIRFVLEAIGAPENRIVRPTLFLSTRSRPTTGDPT